MPRIVTNTAPGRLEIREGGGGIMLFGLPFLAAGLFVLLGALDIIPLHRSGNMSTQVAVPFGLVFALVGAGFITGRRVATLDVMRQIVTTQWRLLVPLRTTTSALGDYQAVTIRFVPGDRQSGDRYPVGLKPATGVDLVLAQPTTYAEARALAATVAQHADVDVEDDSTDHASRVSARDADRPLQQRLQAEHATALPPKPAAMRSDIDEDNGALRLSVPPSPLSPLIIVAMEAPSLGAFVIVATLLPTVMRRGRTSEIVFFSILLAAFVVVPSLWTMTALLRSRVARTIVTISPAGIRVDARRLFIAGERNIATLDAADILDIDFSIRKTNGALGIPVKGEGVIIKSRTGVTTFGEGLGDDEIRYLYALVRRALVQVS